MLTAKIYRDHENCWNLFCPELNIEIPLVESADLIAAAELTGWQACACGELTCRHPTREATVVAAQKMLCQHNQGVFYLPWESSLGDRVSEAWECACENYKSSPSLS